MTGGKAVARRPQQELAVPITKEQAMYLLRTIWPKAPETEVIKAGILCQQYGLNPLMRQVYLIEFGKDWAIVLGIKATRQIAQQALRKQGIRYTYADGPRVMTDKEQMKIRGKVEPDKIWAITILNDQTGNTYPGYGFWPANKQPYGTDKGNDALNMAFIRSERNALDKLAPGELPDIEVGDDTYIEGGYRVAIEKGKQAFNKQVEKDIDDLWGEKLKADTITGEIVEGEVVEHQPAKAPVAASKIKPRAEWDKITREEVSTYPKLETVFHTLTDKQPKEMYIGLGGGNRNDMAISAWDAFITLRERFAPGIDKESS